MTAYNFTKLQPYMSPWIAGTINTVGGYFNYANTTGAAGLASGDTITATGLLPEGGVTMLQVLVLGAPADTNGTPTGVFSLGDSLTDSNHVARYILAGTLAKTNGTEVIQYQNVTPAFVSGLQTVGVGYPYMTNQQTNSEQGNVDIVLTVTAAMATAATSGVLYVYVTYMCTGDV